MTESENTTTTSVTVGKPVDHFSEMVYVGLVLLLLLFAIEQGHAHNDQLAAKAMDFVYIVLGALTQASTSSKH